MRLGVCVILTLAGCISASGQGGFIAHLDSIQSGRNGTGVSVREVDDGYLVFVRQFAQEFPTRSRVFIRKIDSFGIYMHEYVHRTGENRDFDIGMIDGIADLDNGHFSAALAEGYGYSGETWLYTFNSFGDTLSRKFLTAYPSQDSIVHAIRQSRGVSGGGTVLCGFYSLASPTTYAFLIRNNELGDTLWTKKLGIEGQAFVALGVIETNDGGFLLTGYRNYGNPWNKSFLIRTDAQGNELWRRFYGGIATQNGAVRIAADGNIITWSAYREPGWDLDWQQMMLTKWSPGGSILWQRRLNKNYRVSTQDLEVLPDGSIIGAGVIWNRAALVRFSAEGDSLWTREYTLFSGSHGFWDVQPTSDGGFVCTGAAFSFPPLDPGIQTNQVIWVVKTDSLGCVVPGCNTVGVEEYVMDLNEHLRVWPNPVASGAPLQLSFTPPPEFTPNGHLRVVLLDALGRQIHEQHLGHLGHSERSEGVSTAVTASLAAGLYYLHLTDGTRWLAGAKVVVE